MVSQKTFWGTYDAERNSFEFYAHMGMLKNEVIAEPAYLTRMKYCLMHKLCRRLPQDARDAVSLLKCMLPEQWETFIA